MPVPVCVSPTPLLLPVMAEFMVSLAFFGSTLMVPPVKFSVLPVIW